MSICRFTQESDVYAYEAGPGRFVVQVAVLRFPFLDEDREGEMDLEQFQAWMIEHGKPIGGLHDGQVFQIETVSGLVEQLRDLDRQGYRVEASAWEQIEKDYPGHLN